MPRIAPDRSLRITWRECALYAATVAASVLASWWWPMGVAS